MNTEVLGIVYTFAEAAARLKVSRRNFQGIIHRHPHYFRNGKKYLFTESDLLKIVEALRSPEKQFIKDERSGEKPFPSEAALYARARKLTSRKPKR